MIRDDEQWVENVDLDAFLVDPYDEPKPKFPWAIALLVLVWISACVAAIYMTYR